MKTIPGQLEGTVHRESRDLDTCLQEGKVSCGAEWEEPSGSSWRSRQGLTGEPSQLHWGLIFCQKSLLAPPGGWGGWGDELLVSLLRYDLNITWSPANDFYLLLFFLGTLHKEIPSLSNFLRVDRVLGFLQFIHSLIISRSKIEEATNA